MYSLLQLNAWCGRAPRFLEHFDELISKKPTIICMQEVLEGYGPLDEISSYSNSLQNNVRVFHEKYWNEYEFYYSPRVTTWVAQGNYSNEDSLGHWGNLIMWRRDRLVMMEARTKFIFDGHDTFDHKDDQTLPVNMQGLVFRDLHEPEKLLTVCNIHGWYGGKGFGKGDSPERIKQSQAIIDFVQSLGNTDRVLVSGDFNIRPDTESMKIIEQGINPDGNIIRKFGIPTTRTTLYDAAKRANEPHAGYVLLGDGLVATTCVVNDEMEVSDHAPIWIDFK